MNFWYFIRYVILFFGFIYLFIFPIRYWFFYFSLCLFLFSGPSALCTLFVCLYRFWLLFLCVCMCNMLHLVMTLSVMSVCCVPTLCLLLSVWLHAGSSPTTLSIHTLNGFGKVKVLWFHNSGENHFLSHGIMFYCYLPPLKLCSGFYSCPTFLVGSFYNFASGAL